MNRADIKKVGDTFYRERSARRLSQAKLQELSGLPFTLISNVEHGKRPLVSLQTVYTLAKALGLEHLTLEELCGAERQPQAQPRGKKAVA